MIKIKTTRMYKTEINKNILICDYYCYKNNIREQQNSQYSYHLKLKNLLLAFLIFKQTCKKAFPF